MKLSEACLPVGLEANKISPEAHQFVAGLLRRDPATRPTIAKALNHPWIRASREATTTATPTA
ncbi:hypothetical protein QBC34DRAFT_386854 [Podospora aff. communis PSN243]|uniref:Protein kinase domain-containing protein n=1 Tax=Podospora aff. communis PSN243 TaxID=3040156 RepID=A0AAV9G6C8_9PEZI|nr:hypothetical protein QBC34DRAFT_386854 [Podospora aff. communis PSN243]